MDLQEFADRIVETPSLRNMQATMPTLYSSAYDLLQNESRTDPTVAAILSQIVLLTDEFAVALRRRSPWRREHSDRREIILLRRSSWSEYVLLVAEDPLPFPLGSRLRDFPSRELLQFRPASLLKAWERWRLPESSQWASPARTKTEWELEQAYQRLSLEELLTIDSFPVYYIERPPRIHTRVPTPAWTVTSAGISGRATAGCNVRHADGRQGTTSARHFFGRVTAIGTNVMVSGRPGTVAEEDAMTDSVFIHMPSGLPPATARGLAGRIRGVAPRVGEASVFDGATTTTPTTTAVAGHDPGVWQYSPYRQARVYTPPVTNPGDSGAALVENSSDLIVGFAHERTKAGALLEWSSWIWADSAFTALRVEPA